MNLSEIDYQELQSRFPDAYAFMMKRAGIKEVKDLCTELYDGCQPVRETWIRARLQDIYNCAPWLYTEGLAELSQNIK